MSGRRLRRGGLAACGLLLGAAAVNTGSADDAAFTSTDGPGASNGAEIYAHICQGCHMPGGQGAQGAGKYPKLAGDPALVSWEYAAITVLNGKDNMPAFGLSEPEITMLRTAHLDDAQIAEVVNYVRKHFGNHFQGTVTAAEVAKLPHP